MAYAYGGYSNDGPDGCVGGLPSGGGARVWELCDTDASRRDTITTADWPAERRDGAVALVRRRWSPIGRTPYYSELALRPAGDGQAAARVLPIPYPAPGAGVPVQGVAFPAWLDDHRLLVLAQVWMRSLYDNVDTGLEIEILDLTLGTSGVTTIPGTLYASSVAPGATPDTIYFTLGGDSLVYRRALSSGVVDTVVDFGALGIARDVQVRNGRLVAVVGGSVAAGAHPYLGYAQYDGGGPLYLVTLGTGQPTLVESVNDRWKHPTLDPAGTAVIAEQGGDLWRIPLP